MNIFLFSQSDDCSTATCSDVESQPHTPNEAATLSETDDAAEDLDVVYDDKENVFKIPQRIPIPRKDEICKRTRSKLSLEGTAIENLQKPLLTTDLPVDILCSDSEWEADEPGIAEEPWHEFLEQFQQPLGKSIYFVGFQFHQLNSPPLLLTALNDAEDGEETDPEYVFNEALAAAMDEGDSVVVSRRESDLLLKGLLDEIQENVNQSLRPDLQTDFEEPIPLPPRQYQLPAKVIEELEELEVPPTVVEEQEAVENEEEEQPMEVEGEVPTSQEVTVEAATQQLLPPAGGVDALGIIVPTTALPMNFTLVHGSDQNLYLLPTLPATVDVPPKPKTAFLEINVNDDMATIVAQINQQRIINYQHSMVESLEISGWTAKAMRILHRQLLTHIQLLGQMFVQTFCHPTLWRDAKQHKQWLDELVTKAETTLVLRVLCWNLTEMQVICRDWEAEVSVESEANQEYVRELVEGALNPRIVELLLSHRAFMFAEHLPKKGAFVNENSCATAPSRGILFVRCMKRHGCRESRGANVAKMIKYFQGRYNEKRCKSSYYKYIDCNPHVREFLNSGRMPAFNVKEYESGGYGEVVPLREKVELLPETWKSFLREAEEKKRKEKVQLVEGSAPTMITASPQKITMNYSNFKAQFEMPSGTYYYGVGDPQPPESDEEEEGDLDVDKDEEHDEGVAGLETNSSVDHAEDEGVSGQDRKRCHNGELVKTIKEALRKQGKVKKPMIKPISTTIWLIKKLTNKLNTLLWRFEQEYDENMDKLEPQLISTKLFYYFKEFDTFLRLLFVRFATGSLGSTGGPTLTNIVDVQMFGQKREEDEQLPSEPNTTDVENGGRDSLFAWKYLDAIRREVKKDNFDLFLNLLKKLDLKRESVVDFYLVSYLSIVGKGHFDVYFIFVFQRIEELFLPDFSKLLNIFLVHLLPRHLARAGKFLEQAITTDSLAFQTNLQNYWDHRQELMDQIYDLLNREAIQNSTDMNTIKERFALVVNRNPLMKNWFLELLPAQRTRHSSALQFAQQENKIFMPIDLFYLIELMEQRELPPLNLQLSESEEEDDSVEYTGVEAIPSPEFTSYTILSPEPEVDVAMDQNETTEIFPKETSGKLLESSIDISAVNTDCVSDVEQTDYTE